VLFDAVLLTTHVNFTTLHEDENGQRREDDETQKNFDHDVQEMKK